MTHWDVLPWNVSSADASRHAASGRHAAPARQSAGRHSAPEEEGGPDWSEAPEWQPAPDWQNPPEWQPAPQRRDGDDPGGPPIEADPTTGRQGHPDDSSLDRLARSGATG